MSFTVVSILVALAFVGGYLVGANNPLKSVKQKIVDAAIKAAGDITARISK